MAFVYGESGAYFTASVCILTAALLYTLLKQRSELFIIARVYTLAFHIALRACSDIFISLMDSSTWMNEQVLWWWGLVNLVLHLPFLIWYFRKKENVETALPEPTVAC
ncbi:hypothetical protein GEMRC1_007173 [Eukaryota sp. GEM-RC1]